jgi:fused signal recognition particle receptor
MINGWIASVYQQLNSEAYTKMSKLFSWFKKDKPKQDSADSSAKTEAEELALEQLLSDKEQVDSDDSARALEDHGSHKKEHKGDVEASGKKATKDAVDDISPDAEARVSGRAQEVSLPESNVHAESEKLDASTVVKPQAKTIDASAKVSFFARLKVSLSRTKNTIGSGFSGLLLGKTIDDKLFEELETQLLLADVGMSTTTKIISQLTKNAKSSSLKDGVALSALLQSQMQTILDKVDKPIDFSIAKDDEGKKHPFVILMVGVNGVGKTTTIGKLAKQFQAQGKTVMLAAGDTFRAAAVEQLQVWGERNNIPVVAQHTGADSASVIFDAIESASAKKVDILIADTAGRLQNKDHLIEELKKVVRVMKKLNPHAPHEIMLTLDASTGQNAISQTKIFNEAVGITGINLTKLDGTAKGGVIFALADQFAIPVRYIGIGEGIDDLREFESKAFVEALFSE